MGLDNSLQADIVTGLDVIGSRAWPALPTEYFGRDLLEDARLVAVGHMTEGTHGLVHTEGKRTYLRGSSNHFHLCK